MFAKNHILLLGVQKINKIIEFAKEPFKVLIKNLKI